MVGACLREGGAHSASAVRLFCSSLTKTKKMSFVYVDITKLTNTVVVRVVLSGTSCSIALECTIGN
jgi:hypothetical protein